MATEVDRAEKLLIDGRVAAEAAAETFGQLEDDFYDHIAVDDILGILAFAEQNKTAIVDLKISLRASLEKLEALELIIETIDEEEN